MYICNCSLVNTLCLESVAVAYSLLYAQKVYSVNQHICLCSPIFFYSVDTRRRITAITKDRSDWFVAPLSKLGMNSFVYQADYILCQFSLSLHHGPLQVKFSFTLRLFFIIFSLRPSPLSVSDATALLLPYTSATRTLVLWMHIGTHSTR